MNKELATTSIRLLAIYSLALTASTAPGVWASTRNTLGSTASFSEYAFGLVLQILATLLFPALIWGLAPFAARFMPVSNSTPSLSNCVSKDWLAAGVFLLGLFLMPTAAMKIFGSVYALLSVPAGLTELEMAMLNKGYRGSIYLDSIYLLFAAAFVFAPGKVADFASTRLKSEP